MASKMQVAANRENGSKGGVKSEEGKAVSSLNARKHGIFAAALTPEDAEDLQGIEDRLAATLRPAGALEEMMVEKLALTYLRMQRCARAEAEYHVKTWEEPNEKLNRDAWLRLREKRKSGARAVIFDQSTFERMVKTFDLYDVRLTNQFLKLTREIERLQRLRKDADAPWPPAPDVAAQPAAEKPREDAPPEAAVSIPPMPPISPITPMPAGNASPPPVADPHVVSQQGAEQEATAQNGI